MRKLAPLIATAAVALIPAPAGAHVAMLDARIEAATAGYEDALNIDLDGTDGDQPTIVTAVKWCHRKSDNRFVCKITVTAPSRACRIQLVVAKRDRRMATHHTRSLCASRST